MGSSSGGDYAAPNIPAPPANLVSSYGQTANAGPGFVSFLPSDPNAMATGLTPEMLAAIAATTSTAPAAAPAAATTSNTSQQLATALAGSGAAAGGGGGYQTRGDIPGYGASPNLTGVGVPMNPTTDAERQQLSQLMAQHSGKGRWKLPGAGGRSSDGRGHSR